jgi:hypothetical protein
MIRWLFIFICLLIQQYVVGQVETTLPKPPTFTNYSKNNYQGKTSGFLPSYNQSNNLSIQEYNNQLIRQEVQYYENLKKRQNTIIEQSIEELKSVNIKYKLPSLSKFQGTEHYRNAFEEISFLLESKNFDLKKAVFITENAFARNQLDYQKFSNAIRTVKDFCQKLLRNSGHIDDDLARNIAAFRFMADTIAYYSTTNEKKVLSYPMKYDFEDYDGKKDWSKMFVTKLLSRGTGQCHSLPLFFMILSQELGSEAYLSYSPSHSFIKIRDDNNKWYNLELTNGMIISDAAIVESGFIKAEAIRNKIYLDTIGIEKVMASTLVDLAAGYRFLYGYDEFVIKCVNKSLEYFPNNIYALQLLADYYTLEFGYIAHQYKKPPLEVLLKDEQAKMAFEHRNNIYKKIDQIGYEPMPSERYEAWLKSLENEKNKKKTERRS